MQYKWMIISSLFILFLVACSNKQEKTAGNKAVDTPHQNKKDIIYTCPMHHQIREHAPAKCPICGMTLVPIGEEPAKNNTDTIAMLTISTRRQLLAGIQTDTVRIASLPDDLTLTGTTIFDPKQQDVISARVSGWIEQMYVRNPGERISAGQKLYDLYSPDLLSAEKDYLLALHQKGLFNQASVDFTATLQAMRQKLLRWGLSDNQIDLLSDEQPLGMVTVYSRASGYLIEKEKEQGDAVKEGDALFSLAKNSTLWVQAQLYDQELPFLSADTKISVDLAGGRQGLPGKIAFDNPVNEQNSRVHFMNITIPNPDGKIQPGMLAYVHIQTGAGKKGVVIPKSAIIYGEKHNYAWIALTGDHFERRQVQLGNDNQTMTTVLYGIIPGESVVTSGAYLLNSEYALKFGNGANLSGMQMSDMQMSEKKK